MIWVGWVGALALSFSLWLWRQSRFDWQVPTERPRSEGADGSVETVYFHSGDTRIEAWLFEPADPTDLAVVMAPGLTGTKDGLLEAFAWAFVRSGAAVLLFDFRTIGGSGGTPRHWIDPFRQMDDYRAAIAFARRRFGRIVLWGSSFSGGEVLTIAGEHPGVCDAVIAHAPFLATHAALEPRGWKLARFALLASLDLGLAKLSHGRSLPIYVSAFGKPGEFAFSPSPECPAKAAPDAAGAERFWRELPDPPRGGWKNALCARMLAGMDRFVPFAHLDAIRCPVLLVGGEHDSLIPSTQLREAAGRLRDGELHLLDTNHFGLYVDPILPSNLAIQAAFVGKRIGSGPGAGGVPLRASAGPG